MNRANILEFLASVVVNILEFLASVDLLNKFARTRGISGKRL
jgi:hypothetical protein